MARYRFKKQRGVILLTMVLLLLVGSSYVLIVRMNNIAGNVALNERTTDALKQAKEALIAYAVTYYDSNPGEFGFLPCPDANPLINLEGNQDPGCGGRNLNSLGKLPWKTLGIPVLRDASGECLWYAVSGEFKQNTKTEMLNGDTYGTLNVMAIDGVTSLAGATQASRAVAVIIAPGRSVQNQVRTTDQADPSVQICGGNYNAANYLETRGAFNNATLSAAADSLDTFLAATDQTALDVNDGLADVNDVMVFITADEIMSRIQARNDFDDKLYDAAAIDNLTRVLAECVREYGLDHDNEDNYSLPWPAPIDLVDYRDDAEYNDVSDASNILSGRLPDIVDDSRLTIDPGVRTNLITGCSQLDGATPQEQEYLALWQNWKDHFFYAVAEEYQPIPDGNDTGFCGNGARCITINNSYPANANRDYAAVVIFSNSPLAGQTRNAPPVDADTKSNIANYLEDVNNTVTYMDNPGDSSKRFDHVATSDAFNDILYCVNDHDGIDFEVTLCPTN